MSGEFHLEARTLPIPGSQWPEARGTRRQLDGHPSVPTKVAQWIMGLEAVLTENGVRKVIISPEEQNAITMAASTLIKHMRLEFPDSFDEPRVEGVPRDGRTGSIADDLIERAEEIRQGVRREIR